MADDPTEPPASRDPAAKPTSPLAPASRRPADDKEAALAKALRDNLRRRKAKRT